MNQDTHSINPMNWDFSDSNSDLKELVLPKFVKLNFPKYNGEGDPITWISRYNRFFTLHCIHEKHKVYIVGDHLKGDAHIWFDLLMETQNKFRWPKLKEPINSQFSPLYFMIFLDLTRLTQIGTVKEYHRRLLARVKDLTKEQKVSSYVISLKEYLTIEGTSRKTKWLEHANELRILFERKGKQYGKLDIVIDDYNRINLKRNSRFFTSSKIPIAVAIATLCLAEKWKFNNFKKRMINGCVLSVMRNIHQAINAKTYFLLKEFRRMKILRFTLIMRIKCSRSCHFDW